MGGTKCSGPHDLLTQVASEAVSGCGPLSSEAASARDRLRRRSWAARKVAVLCVGEGGGEEREGEGGAVCVRVRARSSIEWLSRAWRVVSGATLMGAVGEMV